MYGAISLGVYEPLVLLPTKRWRCETEIGNWMQNSKICIINILYVLFVPF